MSYHIQIRSRFWLNVLVTGVISPFRRVQLLVTLVYFERSRNDRGILPFSPNLRSVCSVGAELFSTEPQLRSVSVPVQTGGCRLPGEHTDTHFNSWLNMSYLCWIQVVHSLVCLCFHPGRFHSATWRLRWRQRWMSPQSGDTWSSTRPSLISYWHRYDLLTLWCIYTLVFPLNERSIGFLFHLHKDWEPARDRWSKSQAARKYPPFKFPSLNQSSKNSVPVMSSGGYFGKPKSLLHFFLSI